MIVLSGVGSTWSGVLNAKDRFVLAGLRGALTPLAAVVGLLVAPPGRAIYGLAGGTVTGMALEAVVLAWALKREGFSCLPHWSGYDSELRAVLSQYAPMAAGALLLGCTSVIDPAMAALAGPGSVAALGYGNKLVALVLGVASMGLGTAVFPHFSRMAAANDWKGLRNTLNTYTRILLVCTIPVTVVIMLFSADIVRLLFERGNFTAGDTELVGTIQCFYALQIPFYLVGILAVRLISALRANHFMMFVAALTLCQDVLCNLLLIPRLGVAGVGVSNALVYIVSCCLLVFAAHRRLRRMERAYG
jgi:putative peptidoglycan lipid II flippase